MLPFPSLPGVARRLVLTSVYFIDKIVHEATGCEPKRENI